jgi:hypothetical protein
VRTILVWRRRVGEDEECLCEEKSKRIEEKSERIEENDGHAKKGKRGEKDIRRSE